MLNLLRNSRGGISDLAGFTLIIVGLVMIPFIFSFQIFQFYYLQNISYTSSALTLRYVEVGYSEPLALSYEYPDTVISQKVRDEIEQNTKDFFLENMELQGITINDTTDIFSNNNGELLNLEEFSITDSPNTPFITLEIHLTMPVRYARGLIGQDILPIHIKLTGRKTVR